MQRSNLVNFELYNKRPKADGTNLLDMWLAIALDIIDLELKEFSDLEIYTKAKKSRIHPCDITHSNMVEDGELKKNLDYLITRQLLEYYWDSALHNSSYFSVTEFTEIVGMSNPLSEKSYQMLNQQSSYTFYQLLEVIISIIQEDLGLKISKDEFISISKQIMVTYILQKFLESHNQLSWCLCPKVSIGERVVMLIMSLEKLRQNYKPQDCTSENPLNYTSFGAGGLLYDFIAVWILNDLFGYHYFNLNFIDNFYDQTICAHHKTMIEEALLFQLRFCRGDFKFKFFENSSAYLQGSLNKNHLLVTIDTIHHGNSKGEFKELIKKTCDSNTIIGSLTKHKIRYNFKAPLKL